MRIVSFFHPKYSLQFYVSYNQESNTTYQTYRPSFRILRKNYIKFILSGSLGSLKVIPKGSITFSIY